MLRSIANSVVALALLAAVPISSATPPPDNWDGLAKVPAKRMQLVYLQPGADFRGYTKVMLDPTQVSFRKNWQRDHNDAVHNVDNSDVRRILDEAQKGFQKVFEEAYTKGGFEVVTAPGPDVLRLSTAVVNLDVAAPDLMTAGRSWTFSSEAGEATLVLEARDSLTGALLGRAADRRVLDDMRPYLRTSVSNASDFEQAFKTWAKASVAGLTELKELSPVDPSGMHKP